MTHSDSATRRIVGADIGGANLKYCSIDGQSLAKPFPMWEQFDQLAHSLRLDLKSLGPIDSLAVTMTGELADCFADRAIGVQKIVDEVMLAAAELQIHHVAFYGVDGRFHGAAQAKSVPDSVAAANWHALASFVARTFPNATTVVDIGSTTTDIIPLSNQSVATVSQIDHDRLIEGSLVYVGCRRTPVCALVDQLRFLGTDCPVMNEIFATIDDARLLIGTAEEDPNDWDTADHGPRTRPRAANRMARMIGLDHRTVTSDLATELARQVIDAASQQVQAAFQRIHRSGMTIVSGHGDELLDFDTADRHQALSDHLGLGVSRCAPAFAVAWLYASCFDDVSVPCGA